MNVEVNKLKDDAKKLYMDSENIIVNLKVF